MVQRRDLRRAATMAALLISLPACGGEKPAARSEPASPASTDQAQSEAAELGAEITSVLDRVLAYATSRSGLKPRTVAEVGLDSLTPVIVRRVATEGTDLVVSAAFRRAEGRRVVQCRGTKRVLEDLTLLGHYELACTMAEGGTRTFVVEPAGPGK